MSFDLYPRYDKEKGEISDGRNSGHVRTQWPSGIPAARKISNTNGMIRWKENGV